MIKILEEEKPFEAIKEKMLDRICDLTQGDMVRRYINERLNNGS